MDYVNRHYRYKPFKYFFLTLVTSWILQFIAAYFSNYENLTLYKNLFMYFLVLPPFVIAMFMIYGSDSDELKNDFWNRLTNLNLIEPKYLPIILLIMPTTLILATTISLFFRQPIEQFAFSQNFSMMGGIGPTLLFTVILAPTFEELGWRGYGVDSLSRKERSLFKLTLIFGLLWNLFHLPLFLIKGYYHYEILHTHIIYGINFIISVFALAFLANWIYYKNNRSIPANIFFHASANLSFSLLQTEQFTKCIITIILLLISLIVFQNFKYWWLNKNLDLN